MPDLSAVTFDPHAWVVWENFTEQQYVESSRLVISPRGEFGGTKNRVVPLPSRIAEIIRIMRNREHEWAHFRQYISTEWGLFCYRLCAARELAALKLFESLNESGKTFELMPLDLRLSRFAEWKVPVDAPWQPDDREAFWSTVWRYADLIDGALWCKSTRIDHLMHAWQVVLKTLGPSRYFQGDSAGALLTSKHPSEALSLADGHVTVADLVEAFARYREFWFAVRISREDAIESMASSYLDHLCPASAYAREFLGITRFHPLLGALADLAILCFRDPFGQPDGSQLCWEEIHPGLCYERAVRRLSKKQGALPVKHEDAYQEALGAFDLDSELLKKRLMAFLQRYAAEIVTNAGDAVRDDHPSPERWPEVIRNFQRSSFLESLSLRAAVPTLFFEHTLASEDIRNKYSSVTRPPVLAQTDGIFIPHGARRSVFVGHLCAIHALSSYFLDETIRFGELDRTVSYARLGVHGVLKLFDPEMIKPMLLKMTGKSGTVFIDAALRRIDAQ